MIHEAARLDLYQNQNLNMSTRQDVFSYMMLHILLQFDNNSSFTFFFLVCLLTPWTLGGSPLTSKIVWR